MRITHTVALPVVCAGLLVVASVRPAESQQSATRFSSEREVRAAIDQYCIRCHNDRVATAGLSLEGVDLRAVDGHAEVLERVVRKLRLGAMPPPGNPRPDRAAYAPLATWITSALDRAAAANPHPGRTEGLHRLNRAEYANAIRDLLDLEGLDYATLLPGDDASHGFDNIAGALGITPTHLDQYLSAARNISRIAVGDVTLPPSGENITISPDLSQDDRLPGLPFGTRGGTVVRSWFPVDADYVFRIRAFTGYGGSESEPNYLEVSVDGERVFFEKMRQKLASHINLGRDYRADTNWELRLPLDAGLREIAVTFVQTTFAQVEDFLKPYLRPPGVSLFRLSRMGGYAGPYVGTISYTGPFDTRGPGNSPSRQRIFTCAPTRLAAEEACAREILGALARRAYRRPVADADLAGLLEIYRRGRARGDFETGIQAGLAAILASPDFLFRIVDDPPDVADGDVYRLSDLDLASRLSFFLWSSIPDEELLDLANRGELREPDVLERQVRRMLDDRRSDALVTNFAGQWLRLRNLDGIDPNQKMFLDFGDALRWAMRRETELLFESVVREDRSVLDLLGADYTFVNERLARHYGIPGIYGTHFRRVPVADDHRRGLLGQASILAVTSHSNRTSPVNRGKWILENLLGAPPPAPPENIPALENTIIEGTLRQRMEQHRRNPVCASCHQAMDPLGFALENFGPLGQWRETDAGRPVDATGQMLDGVQFDGVAGLRAALLEKSDVVVATLAEKLLTYALGRGVEYYDMPAVRAIVSSAAESDYAFSSLILGIVRSVPFQMRAATAEAAPAPEHNPARR